MLNALLQWVGAVEHPVDFLLFSRTAVMIVLIYVWAPWAALPIFARLERMDRALLEAAADLGAPGWSKFLRVTLPLSLPAVLISFLLVFIPTLGDFATASAVGGAGGQMIGNIIQHFLNELTFPSGAVLSVLLLVTAFALLGVAIRFVRSGALGRIDV
ncbi:MAG TPA: ABC transporter permease subunit [Actinomycetota bacterium]|nr:ABC transporter permease subunit [Actinomycetota bacterium]